MKILKINSISEQYKTYFYQKYVSKINSLSYTDHLDLILNDGFGTVGSWARNLCELGIDAKEIIVNDSYLLKKLSSELKNGNDTENILHLIQDFSPDVIIFGSPQLVNDGVLKKIKKIPSVKKTIVWHCAPLNKSIVNNLYHYDFVLTCTPGFIKKYDELNLKSYLLYHSFDTTLEIEKESEKINEIIFIGSLWLYNESNWHIDRMHFLNNIAKEFDSSFYLSIRKDQFLNANLKRILFNIDKYTPITLNQVKRYEKEPKFISIPNDIKNSMKKDTFFAKDMLKRLSQSTMALNFHVGAAGEYAGNIRLFEVTGIGTCLLSDKKKNIGELFKDEKEIIVYEDEKDCIEKIRYLYENPKIAMDIGHNAYERVLKQHTTKHRMQELIKIIEKEL